MTTKSFNEAAAIAAEIPEAHLQDKICSLSFNEAAAIAAEIPGLDAWRLPISSGFNEAAAIAAEILPMSINDMILAQASMRPPQLRRKYKKAVKTAADNAMLQ